MSRTEAAQAHPLVTHGAERRAAEPGMALQLVRGSTAQCRALVVPHTRAQAVYSLVISQANRFAQWMVVAFTGQRGSDQQSGRSSGGLDMFLPILPPVVLHAALSVGRNRSDDTRRGRDVLPWRDPPRQQALRSDAVSFRSNIAGVS